MRSELTLDYENVNITLSRLIHDAALHRVVHKDTVSKALCSSHYVKAMVITYFILFLLFFDTGLYIGTKGEGPGECGVRTKLEVYPQATGGRHRRKGRM